MGDSFNLTTGNVLPSSPIEQLTDQFYAWERRGRGWGIWPYAVEIEPPFRPFYFHEAPPPPRVHLDDGRRPTALSSWADRMRGLLRGDAVSPTGTIEPFCDIEEPEPEPFDPPDTLTEIQLSIPPDLRISHSAAEQWLLALPVAATPVAFEVIGTAESIVVQFACRDTHAAGLSQQLAGHFPEAVLTEESSYLANRWDASPAMETVLVDFGLSQEFMRPLRRFTEFAVDPLIAVAGALEDIRVSEIGLLQILFQPVRHPWAESALRAVTDGQGKPFFMDAPEMVGLAREKVARPLFAAVLRIAARSPELDRSWEIVRALGGALRAFASPASNELIPLTNQGYPDTVHEQDLLCRTSHRSGMLLNLDELVSLVHPPSASVRSAKLGRERARTKAAPEVATGHGLVLGENAHAGKTLTVTLSPSLRLRHMHLVGATGTGKSHLLLQLIRQDLEQGQGLAVLDPHGDLIEQALGYVPQERIGDVVLLDPSEEAFPVGFNVLEAHSAVEKTLLASDLVAVFRRLSTSWGDQMNAVLANAVLAFLESPRGGTLVDLRRFLVDPGFRKEVLATVEDPEIVFFWEQEFPRLRKDATAPILTRLNAFLRPKPIRYIVGQKSGLDLGCIMDEGKILLIKLAHGLVGEENSYLLGALLVSKLQQLALARQQAAADARRPFFLYVDEFHHFATPSLATILTSGRKYGLGLVIAHQDLRQLARNEEVSAAVLANSATRIAFRVSEQDARKLEEGFTSFGAEELTRLGVGEAIARIERSDFDFNLRTLPLPEVEPVIAKERRAAVQARSRRAYGRPLEEVAAEIQPRENPSPTHRATTKGAGVASDPPLQRPPEAKKRPVEAKSDAGEPDRPSQPSALPPGPPARSGKGGAQHVYLQTLIQRWGHSRGWQVIVEKEVLGGLGRADVALEREGATVACEITVTTTPEHELANVQKCLAAGFDHVAVVSPKQAVLRKAKRAIEPNLDEGQRERVHFLTPEELFAFLEEREAESEGGEETVQGYTVKTKHKAVELDERDQRKKAVGKVIINALRRLGK